MATDKDALKAAAKLDHKRIALASLPFMGMISFWQVFDGIVPKMLTNTFGLDNTLTGVIMAIDNIFGLFLLPLFGILSDRCTSKLGRRTPFILVGSAIATISVPMIAMANNAGNFIWLIASILVTLLAICSYRTMTVAVVADITPRPLRTKAESTKKIVAYGGTGIMLVAIATMVPKVENPDYLPLFLVQTAFITISAIVFFFAIKEDVLVKKMHEDSLKMGIAEDEIEKDDSPEAGGKQRVTDPALRRSIAMILSATFFYYMAYNAMTTNISRYADLFYGLAGGSYAIINIVTTVGALVSYVPLANLSLRIGRKKVGVLTCAIMAICPLFLWLVPGFSPVFYVVFLLMGVALGGVDMCTFTMLLELCDANSVGRYSGYFYTVSMAAQVVTPILSGVVMDVDASMLFGYITLMSVFMLVSLALTKHGDTILIDEVARREQADATVTAADEASVEVEG